MVEHAAQRILGPRMRNRVLNRFADGDPKAARAARVFCKPLASELCLIAGAGVHCGSVGLHQQAAIGLLVVADANHPDGALKPEKLASQRQRRAPLPRTGLRSKAASACELVVVGLRDRGVRLMAADRAGAFVLVINVSGRVQRLLQTNRAQQRRRPPERVNIAHLFGNLNPAFRAHLLGNDVLWKDGVHIGRSNRLTSARMQRRRHGFGKSPQAGCTNDWESRIEAM